MAAWLKSNVYRSSCRIFCAVGEGISLSVKFSILFMITFADDPPILYYNCTNSRIRSCVAGTFNRKLDRASHILFIISIIHYRFHKKNSGTEPRAIEKAILSLLPSRLYCRYRNHTGSCHSARGLYRRSGITPCPEDSFRFEYTSAPARCQQIRSRKTSMLIKSFH